MLKEDFDFVDLDIPRTRENRVPVQFGVVGVSEARSVQLSACGQASQQVSLSALQPRLELCGILEPLVYPVF
jgi:hypothetical protein